MSMIGKLIVAAVVVFAVLQVVRPGIPAKPPTAELQVPPDVKHILEKDCYSCHSDQRRLAWFDQIVPAYWLVRHDILTARERLNFSTLGSQPAAVQKATLYKAVNMIQLGAMPLPQFLMLHPEAKVTPEELAALKAYLAPWKPAQDQPGNAQESSGGKPAAPAEISGGASAFASLDTVQPEFNGLPFDKSFANWKLISTTDRGDNNTFRFVLGNEIAVKAAQSGNISPWPDGARLAKVAWQQEPGADGLMHPGKFVQVELMVKDARGYKDTDGWGWGRWRGVDLKPFGKDAHLVEECMGCHQPVRGNDYVYTLPITAAKVNREEVVNNRAAALPVSLPYQPLGWSAITMYVDPKNHAMATLYGDDAAMQAVRAQRAASTAGAKAPAYPAGAMLVLVTWAQRDDPHWFGGRIPDVPLSVEFVQVGTAAQASIYRRFAGPGFPEDHAAANIAEQRASFVQGLTSAPLP
jgi:Haem-binding domain/Cytochrome P460